MIPAEVTVDYNDTDQPLPKAELIKRLQGKDGLICHIISTIDDEVLAAAPNLKVVANVAVGYNNIDVAAATRRGIRVTNTPGVLDDTTADLTWALLMAAARRIAEGDAHVRAGAWKIAFGVQYFRAAMEPNDEDGDFLCRLLGLGLGTLAK